MTDISEVCEWKKAQIYQEKVNYINKLPTEYLNNCKSCPGIPPNTCSMYINNKRMDFKKIIGDYR